MSSCPMTLPGNAAGCLQHEMTECVLNPVMERRYRFSHPGLYAEVLSAAVAGIARKPQAVRYWQVQYLHNPVKPYALQSSQNYLDDAR